MKVYKYTYQTKGLKSNQEDYLYSTSNKSSPFQLGLIVDGVSKSSNPIMNIINPFIESIDAYFRLNLVQDLEKIQPRNTSNSVKKMRHTYTPIFPNITDVPENWTYSYYDDFKEYLLSVFNFVYLFYKTEVDILRDSLDKNIKTTKKRQEYFIKSRNLFISWISESFDFLRIGFNEEEEEEELFIEWKINTISFDDYFEIVKSIIMLKPLQEWWNSHVNLGENEYPLHFFYGENNRLETKIFYENSFETKVINHECFKIPQINKITHKMFDEKFKELVLTRPFHKLKVAVSEFASLTFALSMIKKGKIYFAGVGDVQMYIIKNKKGHKFNKNSRLEKIFIDDSVNQNEYGNSDINFYKFYDHPQKFSSGITASYNNQDMDFSNIKTEMYKMNDIEGIIIMSDGCLSKNINRWTLDKILHKIQIKKTDIHPFEQINNKLNKLKEKHKQYIKYNFKNLLKNDINTLIYFDENFKYQIKFRRIKEYIEVEQFVKNNFNREWTKEEILWIKMMYITYMIFINRNDNGSFYYLNLDKNSILYQS